MRGISIPNVRIPVEPFTAGAVAMQRAGDQLIALGEQQAEEKATADARKADAELQRRLRQMRNGTLGDPDAGSNELDAGLTVTAKPGWRTLQGIGLVNAEPQLNERIDSAYQEILSGLSDRARSKFEPVGLKRTNLEYERVSEAVIDARKKFQTEAADARVSELTQNYIESGDSDDLEALKVDLSASYLKTLGVDNLGSLSGDMRAQAETLLQKKLRDGLTTVHRERINQLLVDDPNGFEAARYFSEHKDDISADQHDTISKAIKEANFKRDTVVAVQGYVAELGIAGAKKKINALAATKGQNWADAALSRLNDLVSERKAAASAAAARLKATIMREARVNGLTPTQLRLKYPDSPIWNSERLTKQVINAYNFGRKLASGQPLVTTEEAEEVVRDLHNMEPSELANEDLSTLKMQLPKNVYEEWEPKILAAKNRFDVSRPEVRSKLEKNVEKVLYGTAGIKKIIPGWTEQKRGKSLDFDARRKNDELVAETTTKLIGLGLSAEATEEQILEILVDKRAFGAINDEEFGSLNSEDVRKFALSPKDITVNEKQTQAFMNVEENRTAVLADARALANMARRAYKEKNIPVPDALKKFDANKVKLENLYIAHQYMLQAKRVMDEAGENGEATIVNLTAKATNQLGFTMSPTPLQIEAQKKAVAEAEAAAREAERQRKLQEAMNKTAAIGAAFNAYYGSGNMASFANGFADHNGESKLAKLKDIPRGWTNQQKFLADLHRAVLLSGKTGKKDGEIVTLYTRGVMMDIGTEKQALYEVPSYFNGKFLNEEQARLRALDVGINNFPSWKVGLEGKLEGEAKRAYDKWQKEFHRLKVSDVKATQAPSP